MKKKTIRLIIVGCMISVLMTGCSLNESSTRSGEAQTRTNSGSTYDMTEEEKKQAQQEEIEEQEKYDLENKETPSSSSAHSGAKQDEIPDNIAIKDKGFITDLDKIFDNVDAYAGKTIAIEGFVRNINEKNFSVLRYYDMPHEDHTDEVTVGINVTYDGKMPNIDDWVVVTGTIESEIYDGRKQPIVKASRVDKQFTWGQKKVTD